jgi:hypothetical protein
VRLAFHCLCHTFREFLKDRRATALISITGAYVGGERFSVKRYRPEGMAVPSYARLILRPRWVQSKRPKVSPILTDTPLSLWGTPTRMGWGKPKVLTDRTLRMFAVQVRMDVSSDWNESDVPSPHFVEWIMGYPPGWTIYVPKIAGCHPKNVVEHHRNVPPQNAMILVCS